MSQQQQTSVRDKDRQQLERVDRGLAAAVPMKVGEAGALQIVPSNMDQAMEFAVMMSKAGDMIRPQFRNNPGACLAISMFAWRVGLDPFVVNNKAYITKNTKGGGEVTQVAYEAQLIHAIINLRAPLAKRLRAEYSGEGQTRRIKIIGYIQGEDEPLEYESPEVKDIKVQNSPLWLADRDQQLWYYGTRAWARRHFPEITMGAYTREEIEDGLGDPDVVTLTPEQREEARQARPSRHVGEEGPVLDAEVETTEFALVDQHGEELTWTDPDEFLSAFDGTMAELHEAGDLKALLAFWESNSGQLGAVRALGGDQAKWANSIDKTYTRMVSELEHRERQQATATASDARNDAENRDDQPGESTEKPAEAAKAPPPSAKSAEQSTAAAKPAAPAAASGKPAPWLFKPEGGRLKPVECADAADFAKRIRDTITNLGYAPSKIHTFMMMLNKPGMDRLEQVEPELHAAVLEHARSEPHGWGG